MKLYSLLTTVNHPEAMVDLRDGSNRIFNCFVTGSGSCDFLKFTTPVGVAQEGYTSGNIVGTDFLQASIGVPVFSETFKRKVGTTLSGELELHECKIIAGQKEFTFHLGRIKVLADLIDRARSRFRTLHDGTPLLSGAVYREGLGADFFIARDALNRERHVVSERFKALAESEGLRINFGEPV